MKGITEFLVPYTISQLLSLILLLVAWKSTRLARLLFSLLFVSAWAVNLFYGLTTPDFYLTYADNAVPLYRNFILGWFSHYNHVIIPLISFGQLIIGIGMLLKGWWVNLACIGAILFLVCIAPLLVGSAFPFSITVSIAAWLIMRNDKKYYLWKRTN